MFPDIDGVSSSFSRSPPTAGAAQYGEAAYRHSPKHSRSPTPQRSTTTNQPPKPTREHNIFKGPEGTVIDLDELKKITVDIRRNLPRGVVANSHAPLCFLFNAEDVVIVRRAGEGSRPIFDRDELKPCAMEEERVIKLAQTPVSESLVSSPPPPPAHFHTDTSRPNHQSDTESDLRYRLIEKKNSEDVKERIKNDPNFVPQGSYYYEVDYYKLLITE